MSSTENDIPLSAMLQTLRRELGDAMRAAKDEPVQFEVNDIELELKVSVTQTTEGNAGIKFWVVNAAGKHKAAREDVHIFRLKLNPVGPDGGDIRVSSSASQRRSDLPPDEDDE